jgi:hypothetical protein
MNIYLLTAEVTPPTVGVFEVFISSPHFHDVLHDLKKKLARGKFFFAFSLCFKVSRKEGNVGESMHL